MAKVLCTFSGKHGDILWSLPTVREIATTLGYGPVDFLMMPAYRALVPLLEQQEYIAKAGVIEDWNCTHSDYGDGPWQPPHYGKNGDGGYERIFHLAYRWHPGLAEPGMALVDFIAKQQGIKLREQVVPFITAPDYKRTTNSPSVAIGFNEQYQKQKDEFQEVLLAELQGIQVVEVTKLEWPLAADVIKRAEIYIGDRSSNWVLAMGLGKDTITYEPHPARHKTGTVGKTFSCPYGKEIALPMNMPIEVCAKAAAAIARRAVESSKAVGAG